jgi:membrane protease YdiL (CAAX protease family)
MNPPATLRPGLFAAVLAPMIACQIVRLYQPDALHWVLWDYASRLSGLTVIALIPEVRSVAFRLENLRMKRLFVLLWIIGLVLLDRLPIHLGIVYFNYQFPEFVVRSYPYTYGVLHLIDITIGIALVAISEEIVFRRLAPALLAGWFRSRTTIVIGSAVMFGAYHWSTSAGNAIGAAAIGVPMMIFYLRAGVLWPVIIAHYLMDLVYFAQ